MPGSVRAGVTVQQQDRTTSAAITDVKRRVADINVGDREAVKHGCGSA